VTLLDVVLAAPFAFGAGVAVGFWLASRWRLSRRA